MPRLFLPAGVNHYTNPSIEVWTNGPDALPDGWNTTGSTISGTPVYSQVAGRLGGYALRIQYTGVAGDAASKIFRLNLEGKATGLAENSILCHSGYYKGSVSGCQCEALVEGYMGGSYVGGGGVTPMTIGAGWARSYMVTASIGASDRAQCSPVFVSGIVEGDALDITLDDLCVGVSSILTDYFDGSTNDACSWSGTANASTSVRAASALDLTGGIAWGTAGTIAAKVTRLGTASLDFGLVAPHDGLTEMVDLRVSSSTAYLYVRNTDASTSAATGGTCAANATSCLVARWTSASLVDINTNGVDAAQAGGGKTPKTPTGARIGELGTGGFQPYAYIGPVIISPTRKSDTWVAAIQADDGAAFDDCNLLWNTYCASGDMLIPLEVNGDAYVKP